MKALRRAILHVCLPLAGWAAVPHAIAHESLDLQLTRIDARVAAHPGDAELYLKRGELHRIRRNWRAARADYDRARDLDPSLDVVDRCMGRMLLEAGKPAGAIEHLEVFLRKRPGDARALEMRGRALEQLGRAAEAAEDYDRAIARHRDEGGKGSPDLYLLRSRALTASAPDRIDEAIRGLDEGLELLGEPVSLQLQALALEERAGRTDSALERLDRIAARAGRREVWLARRGEILAKAGRDREALAAYQEALAGLEGPGARRSREAFDRMRRRVQLAITELESREVRP